MSELILLWCKLSCHTKLAAPKLALTLPNLFRINSAQTYTYTYTFYSVRISNVSFFSALRVVRSWPLHEIILRESFRKSFRRGVCRRLLKHLCTKDLWRLFFGDGPNTVSESTVSNTELSEFFWLSLSSRERERTQWIPLGLVLVGQSELTEFFAELTEFAPQLSEAQWVFFSETVLSKQYSARFLIFKPCEVTIAPTQTLQVGVRHYLI